MAFKLIIIFVLLYFVARAVGNMVQAILKDPKAPPPPVTPRPRPDRSPSWQGPSPHPTRRHGSDIEDARWEDIE